MEAWELAVAFAGAFVAGFLGSVVGLVLGSLRLPAVLLASGSPATAAGTNIAVSAVAALSGGLTHARAGRVSWRIVAWMTPPSVVGAFVGGYFGHLVPSGLLLGVIAAVLLWSGLDLVFELRAAPESHRPRLAATVSGGLIGLLGGAVGLILGTLRMPALLRSVGLLGARRRRHEPRRRLLPRRGGLRRPPGARRGGLARARRRRGRRGPRRLAGRPLDRADRRDAR